MQDSEAGPILVQREHDTGTVAASKESCAVQHPVARLQKAGLWMKSIGFRGVEIVQHGVTAAVQVALDTRPPAAVAPGIGCAIESAVASLDHGGLRLGAQVREAKPPEHLVMYRGA